MSLRYRNSQGTETPVAGLNGTSGELVPSVSVIRSGIYTPSGPVQEQEDLSFSITFSEPMPDNDYQVIFGSSSNDSSSGTIQCAVRSRETTGFTGVIRNVGTEAVPVASSTFTWFAFKLMTDESRALDEQAITQNTANFAPAFSTTTSYAVGDYVTYGGVLYKCTTAHTAGVWVAGHFTQVTVGGQLKVQDISSSITTGDGYAGGVISVYRDGNTVQVLFNSVKTTAYDKTICSGLPRPLHNSYFCAQGDGEPQELGLGSLKENGTIISGTSIAGLGPSKVWDGFITYLTRD